MLNCTFRFGRSISLELLTEAQQQLLWGQRQGVLNKSYSHPCSLHAGWQLTCGQSVTEGEQEP